MKGLKRKESSSRKGVDHEATPAVYTLREIDSKSWQREKWLETETANVLCHCCCKNHLLWDFLSVNVLSCEGMMMRDWLGEKKRKEKKRAVNEIWMRFMGIHSTHSVHDNRFDVKTFLFDSFDQHTHLFERDFFIYKDLFSCFKQWIA
jgi:hypothetical protein